jgi:hypothetical protein
MPLLDLVMQLVHLALTEVRLFSVPYVCTALTFAVPLVKKVSLNKKSGMSELTFFAKMASNNTELSLRIQIHLVLILPSDPVGLLDVQVCMMVMVMV